MKLLDRILGRTPNPDSDIETGRAPQDEAVNLDERSPQLGVRYRDLLILEGLAKAGADLTQPRHATYYLYFDTEEQAQAAASRIRKPNAETADLQQIKVTAVEGAQPSEWAWSVIVDVITVLDFDSVTNDDNFFQGLADGLGGEYDGWEASVVTYTRLSDVE